MIELVKSGVLFNQKQHTYSLDGKQLQGITSTLMRLVFPDQYADVPEAVLHRAAERGSLIHEQVEIADSLGVSPDVPEVQAYIRAKADIGLETVAGEYIVTDGEHFASPIDLVMEDDAGNITLGDIKTTYKLNEAYVSWQLSIYAYLFERQNIGMEVSHLMGVWLRDGQCKFIEVARHADREVESLITAYLNSKPYKPEDNQVALLAPDAVKLLIEATAAYEEAKKAKEDVTAALLRAMEEHHVKSWDTDLLRAAYTPPTESTTFDTKRFQQEHPDLYAQYTKTAMRKATVRVTIR